MPDITIDRAYKYLRIQPDFFEKKRLSLCRRRKYRKYISKIEKSNVFRKKNPKQNKTKITLHINLHTLIYNKALYL